MEQINKYVEQLSKLQISKSMAIRLCEEVFNKVSTAPEFISVSFNNQNLEQICKTIESFDGFVDQYNFTDYMLSNNNICECIMYIPEVHIERIKVLVDVLKSSIIKKDFFVGFENNIFFINNMELLNNSNKTSILNNLYNCDAINVSDQIKWLRKINI